MTTTQMWTLALFLLLAPVARAEETGDDAGDDGDHAASLGTYGKDMFASLGPELSLISGNGAKGGPYTAQTTLPSLRLGGLHRGFFVESDLSSYGLMLVPIFAPSPTNDYSWMVPPAVEDPSVHFIKFSLLRFRFGFALGELGPVQLGLALDGDARTVVYGVYAGGFDTSTTLIGGVEWMQGIGGHAMWDIVDHLRLDVAIVPCFGFDPSTEAFFTSRGVRAFGDVTWALVPDLLALQASTSYEYLDWTASAAPGVIQTITARVGVNIFFDVPR